MNVFFTSFFIVVSFLSFGFSQTISNVQFKDMKGKSYDLYTVLGEEKYVYFLTEWDD